MRRLVAVLVMATGCAVAPALADGYTPEWCAANRNQNDIASASCADATWCKAHGTDDRISRIACDPFRSKADAGGLMPHITRTTLDTGPKLTRDETVSPCFADAGCSIETERPGDRKHADADGTMLPPGVAVARLALRGDIEFGYAGVMHVRVALMNAHEGVLWINGKPYGSRQTRLNPTEISTLVDAINRAQFWRLPARGGHMGVADGKMASIEISVPGRRHHVADAVGPRGAVDLSVLVNASTPIVFAHWKGI
jgi:hypothetical protein